MSKLLTGDHPEVKLVCREYRNEPVSLHGVEREGRY